MKKILTIGGATQDIYLHYEGADYMSITKKNSSSNYMLFKSGDKIEVENILYYSGGGATNSAASFRRLGFDTTCFCKIGNDIAGKFILTALKKEKINKTKVIISKKYPSGTSFIINSLRRERTIFAYRGSNGHLTKKEIPFDAIKKSSQIYITSLSHDSSKLLPNIVKFAYKNNIPIAINPGTSQLAKGTQTLINSIKYIDTFILNSDEAKIFMIALVQSNEEYKNIFKSNKITKSSSNIPSLLQAPFIYENFYFSIRKFFKEILKIGPKIVVITDGANGVYVANKNKIIFHPSIKTNIIDTLGAGDAFGSCFTASLLDGTTIEQALKRGILNSSSVIGKMGAKPGLLNKKQLDKKEKELPNALTQKWNLK